MDFLVPRRVSPKFHLTSPFENHIITMGRDSNLAEIKFAWMIKARPLKNRHHPKVLYGKPGPGGPVGVSTVIKTTFK